MTERIPTHIVFTGVYIILALVTLFPLESASKANILGYKSLCSFSPISTIIFLGLAGLHVYLYSKREKVA